MLTPDRLDEIFPDRRESIARNGGCSETDIPAELLASMTDDQFKVLFSSWEQVSAVIWRTIKPEVGTVALTEGQATFEAC